MGDFDLSYGSDLGVAPNGDFGTVDGDVELRQRLLRRLLTNPRVVELDGTTLSPGYIFAPTYGAGLGRDVGLSIGPSDLASLTALMRQTILAEPAVSRVPAPSIDVTIVSGGVRINISFVSATSGDTIQLPPLTVS